MKKVIGYRPLLRRDLFMVISFFMFYLSFFLLLFEKKFKNAGRNKKEDSLLCRDCNFSRVAAERNSLSPCENNILIGF